ncbi:2'-deoxynucleoside 5'-phosphate N-hydrolase 1-like [Poecilia reticulata]|uniref:2'-deoxynucleoside 5'-phosphate N-hydrolase 1-like n=1 Tax=Poecilia reticulata TaxID=8081 RepID=UPI0007EAE243|nr:PREDICTED: 2'-deoxynucleoside 5'-phosphate N-hydrolase 1-like [Poecilia reticulata]
MIQEMAPPSLPECNGPIYKQVVVAEVTQPSLGVGYELGRAADMKEKKVLCLFRPSSGRALSAMIRGAADGRRLQVVDYSEDQLEAVLDRFFSSLQSV